MLNQEGWSLLFILIMVLAALGLGLAQMLYEQMKRNYGLDTSSINSVGASELSADGK